MYFIIRFAFILLFIVKINAQTYTLDQVVNLIIQNHPDIESFNYKIMAAKNNAIKSSNLPDPKLTIGLNNLPVSSFSFNEEMMTSKSIGIQQNFPFPGKLDLLKRVKNKNVSIINYQKKYFEEDVRKQVSDLFNEYDFLTKKRELIKENRSLNNNLLDVIETKYSVNKAQQKDIFKLQLRINEIDEILIDLSIKIENIISTLSILSANHITGLLISDEINKVFVLDKKNLKQIIFSDNSRIKSFEELKNKAELSYQLSKYTYYPSFSVAVTYAQRGELKASGQNLNDFFSFKIGLSLPLNYGNKKDAEIDEASAIKSIAESKLGKELQDLEIKLNNIVDSYNSAKQKQNIVSNISLIQANESYSSTLTSYMVGKSDIESLINSLETILNLNIKDLKYLKDMKNLLNYIELITGKKISELNLLVEN